MRVTTIEKGKYPSPFVAFMAAPCYHCAHPACIPACPVDAIAKRDEDGIVVVDRGLCLGRDSCQRCLEVCPYKAPQFGAEENAKMQKCDFCLERRAEGKPPICVAGCPMRALDAGPLEDLQAKYGGAHHAVGFTYKTKIRPAVVFKPKPESAAVAH
jgi:anaerobic dimethyl sulfoxide reductase subunit B (iron-sulfur subunit)